MKVSYHAILDYSAFPSETFTFVLFQQFDTAPSAPINVMATAVSFNTITVTWSEPSMPNGEIGRYNITYYETNDGSSDNITLEVSDVSGRTQQLTDLDPFTNYTIIIHAFTGAGIGQPSDPLIVQTNETGIITHSLVPKPTFLAGQWKTTAM